MAAPPVRFAEPLEKEKEYLCHEKKICAIENGLVVTLGGLYLLASQKGDKLPTP
jgi:hypothetical protein